MKDATALVWVTQLGLSVALPLAGFVLLSIWIRDYFSLGGWVTVAGVIVGLIAALDGFRQSLKALNRISHKKEDSPPPVSFNDHD